MKVTFLISLVFRQYMWNLLAINSLERDIVYLTTHYLITQSRDIPIVRALDFKPDTRTVRSSIPDTAKTSKYTR